jgi:hypothetical protein
MFESSGPSDSSDLSKKLASRFTNTVIKESIKNVSATNKPTTTQLDNNSALAEMLSSSEPIFVYVIYPIDNNTGLNSFSFNNTTINNQFYASPITKNTSEKDFNTSIFNEIEKSMPNELKIIYDKLTTLDGGSRRIHRKLKRKTKRRARKYTK